MVKKSNKLNELEFQRKEIEAKIKVAQQEEAGRIGLLAIKAGLHVTKLSNSELLGEFKNIAARFSEEAENSTQAARQNVGSNKDGLD